MTTNQPDQQSAPDHYGTGCDAECIDGCRWPKLPCGRMLRECARVAAISGAATIADDDTMRAVRRIYDGEKG